MRITSPKLTVHTVSAAALEIKKQSIAPQKTRRLSLRSFFSVPMVIVLLTGFIVGSYAVLESKFGQADVEQVANQVLLRGPETPQAIPLRFDNSDLNIVVEDMLPQLIAENRYQPTEEELKNAQRKEKLQAYLATKKSPLAKDDKALDAFLEARNMKMMLAISFVEGNFCRRQLYYNCSGIGGSSKFRHYNGFDGWIRDFDSLLERRYKNLPVEKFIGVYVQPGSQAWVNGVKQILAELKQRGIE